MVFSYFFLAPTPPRSRFFLAIIIHQEWIFPTIIDDQNSENYVAKKQKFPISEFTKFILIQ